MSESDLRARSFTFLPCSLLMFSFLKNSFFQLTASPYLNFSTFLRPVHKPGSSKEGHPEGCTSFSNVVLSSSCSSALFPQYFHVMSPLLPTNKLPRAATYMEGGLNIQAINKIPAYSAREKQGFPPGAIARCCKTAAVSSLQTCKWGAFLTFPKPRK